MELPVFDGSMLRAALTISKPGLAVTPAEHVQHAVARARTGLDELLDRFRVIARGMYPTVLRALPTALSTNWRPICADRCACPEVCPSDWPGRSNRGSTTWRPRRCTGSLAGSAAPHIRPPREPWGMRPRYWPGPARELLAQVGIRWSGWLVSISGQTRSARCWVPAVGRGDRSGAAVEATSASERCTVRCGCHERWGALARVGAASRGNP
jgi:hypothetical protein